MDVVEQADVDIVIIGAGAAGIAAGRQLASTNHSFLVLDAADRCGGRAWTRTIGGRALDLGCGWLHSADRNLWTEVAEGMGRIIDRTAPAWGRQFEDLGFSATDQREANDAYEAFDKRLRETRPPSDRASDALQPDCKWNAYIEARSGYINGVGTAQLSIADYLAYDAADSGENWRLPEGYGACISAAAQDLPLRLNTEVKSVDHRKPELRIDTSRGMLTCKAVIIAVPTSVIAREQLIFDPPLRGKVEAAAQLPLGLANKLFLELEEPQEFAPDRHLLGNPHRAETGSYYLRPFGRPLVEAFYGGSGAQELENAGMAGMVDFALEELCALVGSSFRRRTHPIAGSTWGAEAFIGGSYSHALPGHADARAALRQPVGGRLFFAGEACSSADFSTAHGAFETGTSAAKDAVSVLSRRRHA